MKKIISLFACMACCATFLFSNANGVLTQNVYVYKGDKIYIPWTTVPDPLPQNGLSWYNLDLLTMVYSGSYSNPAFAGIAKTSMDISCKYNVNGIISTTNSVFVQVLPAFTPGTISIAKTSVCYNSSPGMLKFSTNPSGGDGTPSFQWQSRTGNLAWANISGQTSSTYTPGALTQGTYFRCLVDAGAGAKATNEITVAVFTTTSAGAITGGKTICYNSNSGTLSFSTQPAGGTGGYTYQWQKYSGSWTNISGAVSSNYAPGNLLTTTQYRCIVGSSCETVITNSQTITVNPDLLAGIIVVDGIDTICENSLSPELQFSTSPSGEPGIYTYQWQSSPDNLTWTIISGAINIDLAPGILASSIYYRCHVTGSCNVTKSSNFKKINVIAANTISTPQSKIASKYCKNQNVTIEISNPIYKNNWYNSNLEFILDSAIYTIKNIQASKKVYVEAVDRYGCKSEKVALDINVDPIKADFYVSPVNIKVQDSAEFRSTSIGAVKYDWNFGDGMPKGDVSNLYAYYYKAGFFDASLTVTSDIGCTDTKTILEAVHVGVTGINLKNNETLFVYPIPVSDMLTVEYSGNSASSAFIYTLNGQLVKELKLDKTKNSINMSAYPNGAYILKVVSGEGEIYSKTLIKGE